MCISPIKVKNPWYFPPDRRDNLEKRYPFYFLHDTTSLTMTVPCGVCLECKQLNQLSFVQRAIEMGKYCYTIFGTLTYRNENLPILEVNGRKLKFADIRDFVNLVKRIRKYEVIPPFRYLAVTEYGSDENKHHRPHFHFLIFIPYMYEYGKQDKFKGLEYAYNLLKFIPSDRGWSRSLGDSFNPLYSPNSAFIRTSYNYTYDAHLVTGVNGEDVVYYVTKYVLKFSDYVNRLQQALRLNLTQEDYNTVWSIVRPKVLTSNGMGVCSTKNFPVYEQWYNVDKLIEKDISEQIEYSIKSGEQSPQFYINNEKYPLCKYFMERCMTFEQRIIFHNLKYGDPFSDESKQDFELIDDLQDIEKSDYFKAIKKIDKLKNIVKKLNNNKY